MAKTKTTSKRAARGRGRRAGRWALRGLAVILSAFAVAVLALRFAPVPVTPYMAAESRRLGGVEYEWTPMDRIAPVMARSAVAAEDARFCSHWGFDMEAIRSAIESGAARGGSTISQQVAKNVFLWHGRSWARKALEALVTPVIEVAWPKRRIAEVYLNVAEFGEGVFGIGAASRAAFGVAPADLTPSQAARLAAVLPSPKTRSAARPSDFIVRRGASIQDGAALIQRDGRAACLG